MAKTKETTAHAAPAKQPLELYNFPAHGVTIEAQTMEEAQEKLQELLNS